MIHLSFEVLYFSVIFRIVLHETVQLVLILAKYLTVWYNLKEEDYKSEKFLNCQDMVNKKKTYNRVVISFEIFEVLFVC